MFQTYWLWPILLLDYLGQNGGFSNRGYLWSQNRRINCSGSEWRCIVSACLCVWRRMCLCVYCSDYIINNTLSSNLSLLSGRLLNSLSAGIRIHFQDTPFWKLSSTLLTSTFLRPTPCFVESLLFCDLADWVFPGKLRLVLQNLDGCSKVSTLVIFWIRQMETFRVCATLKIAPTQSSPLLC